MPQPKATLKDIAHTLGVSTTTVHRALNGKQGVSDEVSLQIRQLAAQMGYKTNYMASALKRKDIHFAVALPKPTLDDRYYYLNLWQGVRRFSVKSPSSALNRWNFTIRSPRTETEWLSSKSMSSTAGTSAD